MRELKSDLRKMHEQFDVYIKEIAAMDKLLSVQLTTPRDRRKQLIAEYWKWLDEVYEGNFGDMQQAIEGSHWRDTFNDTPPPGLTIMGLHDPYNYMKSVKERLIGHRIAIEGRCESLKTKMGELQARILSIRGSSPWSRLVWVLLGAALGVALTKLAGLMFATPKP